MFLCPCLIVCRIAGAVTRSGDLDIPDFALAPRDEVGDLKM